MPADITVAVPTDVNGRKYAGVQRKLMAGTQVGSTDYAAAHALLVAADGSTALIVASNADAVSNTQNQVPTSARLQTYNGSTWDRARGDTTNGLDVDVTRTALPTGGTPVPLTKSLTTTVAGAFSSQTCKALLVQSDPTNLYDIKVGDATNQYVRLRPGDVIVLPVSNANLVSGANVTSSTQNLHAIAIT